MYTAAKVCANLDGQKVAVGKKLLLIQNDYGYDIPVQILSQGQPVVLDAQAVYEIIFKKPDGKEIHNTALYSSDNTILIRVTKQMTARSGIAKFNIRMKTDEMQKATGIVECEITALAHLDENIDSTDEYTVLEHVLKTVATYNDKIASKVDKVENMGLSENNYTNEDKETVEKAKKELEHKNRSVIDSITQALIEAWNTAVEHVKDKIVHITSQEREKWNAAEEHARDQTVHITNQEREKWNTAEEHVRDNEIHITSQEREKWNAAEQHSQQQHARADATKTEKSLTNGNVVVNEQEMEVYKHPEEKHLPKGGEIGQVLRNTGDGQGEWQEDYKAFQGATETSQGTIGLVPIPQKEDRNKVLCGDGTWKDQNDTTYQHPDRDGYKHVPANGTENKGKYLRAKETPGEYEWGDIQKEDVTKALEYTPISEDKIVHNADISDADKIAGMDLIHSMQQQIITLNNRCWNYVPIGTTPQTLLSYIVNNMNLGGVISFPDTVLTDIPLDSWGVAEVVRFAGLIWGVTIHYSQSSKQYYNQIYVDHWVWDQWIEK